ncbi:MAG: type II secretion system F family protein [Candidatus Omnitrophica bacterium]|nr:type II secretion system F family protein [Candidatus Omnitrophota bacterium]
MNILSQADPLVLVTASILIFCVSIFVVIFLLIRGRNIPEQRLETLERHLKEDRYNNAAGRSLKDRRKEKAQIIPDVFNIQALSEQAGLGHKKFLISNAIVIAPAALFILGFLVWESVLYACMLGVASFFAIYMIILYLKNKRLRDFENQLPQALDIISRSLQAGHPLMAAVELVYQELPDPICTEFQTIYNEQKIGVPMNDSLVAMTERVPLQDLRFFVISVLIHNQVGGNLGEIIGNISSVIRERIKLHRQVKAITASGRLSGWVMCGMPLLMLVLLMTSKPGYINILLQDEVGLKMLYAAIVLQILGMLFIRRIVNIKV